ncbi:MAG: hypothetical protein DRP88_07730 [Candidatus Neomarinimicrobiota bacterium]|nr:MAG: hypothetical protein DRP88_07730 [Candidatus Neomarinimicrobiota bacterium]
MDPCFSICKRCGYLVMAPDPKGLLVHQREHANKSHNGVIDFGSIERISEEDYIMMRWLAYNPETRAEFFELINNRKKI